MLAGHVDWQRADVLSLPLCYAVFVRLFVHGFAYGSNLHLAPLLGAAILSVWMLYSVWQSFDPAAGYYQLKLHAQTPLGNSNYLAVFIGFALLLSSFWKKEFAILLFPALLLTMSRSGILLVSIFLLLRFTLARKSWPLLVLICAGLLAMAWYFGSGIYDFLDLVLPEALTRDSINIRLEASLATIEIIQHNLFVGVPRSFYKDALESLVPGHNLWDPHNSILHLVVSFGLIGFVLYGAYVALVFREIYRASSTSRFWRGACWGYVLILVWSLFEFVLLTPAVELLQAFLFVLARKYNSTVRARTIASTYQQRQLAIKSSVCG